MKEETIVAVSIETHGAWPLAQDVLLDILLADVGI